MFEPVLELVLEPVLEPALHYMHHIYIICNEYDMMRNERKYNNIKIRGKRNLKRVGQSGKGAPKWGGTLLPLGNYCRS